MPALRRPVSFARAMTDGAPNTTSAPSTASLASSDRWRASPGPAATMTYSRSGCANARTPVIFARRSKTSSKDRRSLSFDSFSGLRTNTTGIPTSLAAATFSSNPPTLPLSLVSTALAPVCNNMSTLSSCVKGPCMAIRCPAGIPHSMQILRLSTDGSTRTYSLWGSPISLAKRGRSLLPVVRNRLPGMPRRIFAASCIEAASYIPNPPSGSSPSVSLARRR